MAVGDRPRYSFVIPVHDEGETLGALAARLAAVIDRLDGESEVILVDDGSTDASFDLLVELNRRDPRFKAIRLTRNFGHQLAVTAGLDHAAGDAVVVMDADLQDPPELVFDLVERWRDGYEVVYAVRAQRPSDPFARRLLIKGFYRLFRRLTDVDMPVDAGDFRLVDRKALDAFRSMRENNRYVRGMFGWVGFRQIGVEYQRPARFAGRSKYPLRKLIKLAADGIMSFSNAPLRAALALGFVVSAISFLLGLTAIALRLANVHNVPGWASIVVVVLFLGGVQLTVMGMMGHYVARIYEEVKGRPLYLVREARGFAPEETAPHSLGESVGLARPEPRR
jgi:glycosyltransferase involved in cell wall biosynthesis